MNPSNLEYPQLLDLFRDHLDPNRTESASFLIWYFENYLRLDRIDAVDSVCDQKGDKGIDGIYLNEDSGTIEVFQSKISQKKGRTIGDASLREFAGTLTQFESQESLANLLSSAAGRDVARLVASLDLVTKVKDYTVKGVFLTNSEIDANGAAYLKANNQIEFVGLNQLVHNFISSARNLRIGKPATFDVTGYEVAKYIVDKNHEAVLAPLKARELIQLDGIANQAIFAHNVRGPLGRTQVNKDIAESIKRKDRHKLFPLFHNGITIITKGLTTKKDRIEISDYYVVNGCQSLSELHNNASLLSDDLRVLVKLIKMDSTSALSEMVTSFSNNQNGVKARDFKSNNPIQIRLQNEFKQQFEGKYRYEIKRGEQSSAVEAITNEEAGLYLMAFDLKRPWGTHRKYQVFEDAHNEIFARPIVSASRIVLCHLIAQKVDEAIIGLKNTLFAKYALTRFFLLYVLRLLLERDVVGIEVIESPGDFVTNAKRTSALLSSIESLLSDVVIDLNAELDQLGEDFDYRGKLRDEAWVKQLAHRLVADHEKLVTRKRIQSFASDFNAHVSVAKSVAKKVARAPAKKTPVVRRK